MPIKPSLRFCIAAIAFNGLTIPARASSGAENAVVDISSWNWPFFIVLPLAVSVILYSIGVMKMWHRKKHAGIRAGNVACFGLGWLSLALALDSPIHELGEQLFYVHMVQHEILMLMAAPLLLLGKPSLVFVWALPRSWRSLFALSANPAVMTAWRSISAPMSAWSLHALALWAWHAPALFEMTLHSDLLHALQHTSFFGTALLFWWTLIQEHGRKLGDGAGIVYVFTTAVHMSLLGALLTFAPRVWYGSYAVTAPWWHLTGLEDQQLGGLIMWIPAGTVLLIVTLILMARWMRDSDRRWESGRTAALIRETASGSHES
jgi:putative membrane protein